MEYNLSEYEIEYDEEASKKFLKSLNVSTKSIKLTKDKFDKLCYNTIGLGRDYPDEDEEEALEEEEDRNILFNNMLKEKEELIKSTINYNDNEVENAKKYIKNNENIYNMVKDRTEYIDKENKKLEKIKNKISKREIELTKIMDILNNELDENNKLEFITQKILRRYLTFILIGKLYINSRKYIETFYNIDIYPVNINNINVYDDNNNNNLSRIKYLDNTNNINTNINDYDNHDLYRDVYDLGFHIYIQNENVINNMISKINELKDKYRSKVFKSINNDDEFKLNFNNFLKEVNDLDYNYTETKHYKKYEKEYEKDMIENSFARHGACILETGVKAIKTKKLQYCETYPNNCIIVNYQFI